MNPILWLIFAPVCALVLYWPFWMPQGLKAPVRLSGSVSYVVDGDSLYINSHKPQIRLWGVDAPEKGRTGYKAATSYLLKIAKDQKITCEKVDSDKYGRTVARCFLSDGREINRMMIESRTAKEYKLFSKGFYGSNK